MFIYLGILFSIIALIIASYTDLKERIVHNKLTFGMLFLGLTIFGIKSILFSNPIYFIEALVGGTFGFLFGFLLWKLGVFAGGDVKLFMGLGALNPHTPLLLNNLFQNFFIPIFPITLFINTLIGFIPWATILIIIKLINKKELRKKIFNDYKKEMKKGIKSILTFSGLFSIIHITKIGLFLEGGIAILLSFIITFIIKRKFKTLNEKYIIATIILTGMILNTEFFFKTLIGLFIISIIFVGFIKVLFSTRKIFSKNIKINDLEEGMIPSNTILLKNKKIIEKKVSFIQNIKNPQKNVICSPLKARGFNKKELKLIKNYGNKAIEIKDSIPFIPSIFVGYIISLLIGDFIILFIL